MRPRAPASRSASASDRSPQPRRDFTKRSFTIFHLDGEDGLRGGERQLLYLAAALRARGHRGVVACRGGSPLEAETRRLGIETLALPYLMEWDPVSSVRLLAATRRAERPILHAHTGHAAALACLAGSLGRLPRVAHRRVDFAVSGACSRRLKYDSAARVVAVSEAIKGVLAEDGLASEHVAVVPDGLPLGAEECAWAGVPVDRFSPADPGRRRELRAALSREHGVSPDAAWVGNLAALVPHKDHDTLLAAAVLVLMKRPDTVFLIGGEGPEGPRLLESVKKMGLLGRVLLLGQVADAGGFLRCLDVFALSSWGEGMGSVLLEAAACGAPVAATSAGGIPEVVENGRTGLLVPPRDAEALAKAILRLLDDRTLAGKLAHQGRIKLADFSLKRMAERMEDIYEAVA